MSLGVRFEFVCSGLVDPEPGNFFSIIAHAERQFIKAAARKNKRIPGVPVTLSFPAMFLLYHEALPLASLPFT